MTIDEDEYEVPARGDKAEAIRNKYCLENNQVYHSDDDDIFFKEVDIYKNDEWYMCFTATEIDSVEYKGKTFYIKRIKN